MYNKDHAFVGFKATNRDLTCLDYQYAPNQTFEMTDFVIPCSSGFHFCQNIFDIFKYYDDFKIPRIFNVSCEHALVCNDKTVTEKINFGDEIDYNTGIDSDNEQFAGVCIANLILQGIPHENFKSHVCYYHSVVQSVMGMYGYIYDNFGYVLFNKNKHKKLLQSTRSNNYYMLYGLAHVPEIARFFQINSVSTTIFEILIKQPYIFNKVLNSKIEYRITDAIIYGKTELLESIDYDFFDNLDDHIKIVVANSVTKRTDKFDDLFLKMNNHSVNCALIKNNKFIEHFAKLNIPKYNIELIENNYDKIDPNFDLVGYLKSTPILQVINDCIKTGYQLGNIDKNFSIDHNLKINGYRRNGYRVTSYKNRQLLRSILLKNKIPLILGNLTDENIDYMIEQYNRMQSKNIA